MLSPKKHVELIYIISLKKTFVVTEEERRMRDWEKRMKQRRKVVGAQNVSAHVSKVLTDLSTHGLQDTKAGQ